MKNTWKLAPLFVLAFVMFGCGGGGGTPDARSIGDAVLSKAKAHDFDSIFDLTDQSDVDVSAAGEIRNWRIAEGYERWKDYKKELEGDEGMDPKSKSGIDGEDAWKSMSKGKGWALRSELYRVYIIEDLEKRLNDGTWALTGINEELDVEGQGRATISYVNQYYDAITVRAVRKQGLWYLSSVKFDFAKETPKKPKDE